MKFFAITPDGFTGQDVLTSLPHLVDKEVSFLYLRSNLLQDCIKTLKEPLINAGILPMIPWEATADDVTSGCGVHIKNARPDKLPLVRNPSTVPITASCHDCRTAASVLQNAVDYVFISPVFTPLSKPDDSRKPLSRRLIKELVAGFGERIVLLGGMTSDRVHTLQRELHHDFSVGGITMFFGEQQ